MNRKQLEENLPDGWVIRKIGNLTEVLTGGTPSKSENEYWLNGNINWMLSGDINQGIIREVSGKITKKGMDNSAAKLLPKKSIMIALNGQGKTKGKVGYLTIETTCNQSLASIIPNEKFISKYLYYNLQSRYLEIRGMSDIDNRTGLNLGIIRSIILPLPLLPEQKKIADILTTWDNAIDKTESLINAKTNLKKGLMQKLLTGKVRFKEFEGQKWELVKIKDCCHILDTKRIPLNQDQRKEMKGDIPYYGANGVVDFINKYIFEEELILMAEDGGHFENFSTRSIAYKISGKSWVNNHAHVLKAKNKYNQDFLFFSIVHKNIIKFLNGGTRAKLNRGELEGIIILVPSLPEQQKIASVLSTIDKEIGLLNNKLDILKQQKKGLMQKLLTGKVRVKV